MSCKVLGVLVAENGITYTYLRLPEEWQRSAGHCDCPACQHGEAFWDTLVVPSDIHDHTWTVHMPIVDREFFRSRSH